MLETLTDDSVDVESLILSTDVPGLSILPAGKPHEGATELLASARMAKVAAPVCSRYTPHRDIRFPAAAGLKRVAGPLRSGRQIVLVVCSGKTPRHAVLDALEQLDNRDSSFWF